MTLEIQKIKSRAVKAELKDFKRRVELAFLNADNLQKPVTIKIGNFQLTANPDENKWEYIPRRRRKLLREFNTAIW